jgi:ABC-type transport system involved in cytochrome c biogenesis permease component
VGAEREQRALDGLVLAPCDRSAIWLGKALASLASSRAELVALPAFALFFSPLDAARSPASLLATSASAPSARCSRRWRRRAARAS